MRKLKFKIEKDNFPEFEQQKMTRTYRTVLFKSCSHFGELTVLQVCLLEGAEYIHFSNCQFKDFLQFNTVVDYCKKVKELYFSSTKFNDLSLTDVTGKQIRKSVPIKCTLDETTWRALSCIQNISELDVYHDGISSSNLEGMAESLPLYAPVLKSLLFNQSESSDQILLLLTHCQNLKLEAFQLSFDQALKWPALECFLKKQQDSITFLSIDINAVCPHMLDIFCKYLGNLEHLECKISIAGSINLNIFKNLSNLDSMDLVLGMDLVVGEDNGTHHVDISELPLKWLLINSEVTHPIQYLSLFDVSSRTPMTSMKFLQIKDVGIHKDALSQIIRMMPNLESLGIAFCVSIICICLIKNNNLTLKPLHFQDYDRSNTLCDDAFELNKLIHLRELRLQQEQFNDFFLHTLKLPELRRLIFLSEVS
jgi:hypothetical protein